MAQPLTRHEQKRDHDLVRNTDRIATALELLALMVYDAIPLEEGSDDPRWFAEAMNRLGARYMPKVDNEAEAQSASTND